ncbi:MAG: hypothetical protein FWF06_03815 [Symbiobacteriaceae bacterium]|nr:hypothetical protein [Symbiobacteriaceae bacterium]
MPTLSGPSFVTAGTVAEFTLTGIWDCPGMDCNFYQGRLRLKYNSSPPWSNPTYSSANVSVPVSSVSISIPSSATGGTYYAGFVYDVRYYSDSDGWNDGVVYTNIISLTIGVPSTPPSTPASITVTPTTGINPGVTNMSISWQASSGATSYTLQRQANGGTWTTVYSGGNTSSSDMSQSSWTSIAYRVSATGAGGTSGYRTSPTYSIVTAPGVPSSITIPAQVRRGEAAAISWASVTGATSYQLERQINSGAWSQIYTGSATSYSDAADKSTWVTVAWRVRATNSAGSSSYRTSDARTVLHPTIELASLIATNLTVW